MVLIGLLGEDFIRLFKTITIDLRSDRAVREPYPGNTLNRSENLLCAAHSEIGLGHYESAIQLLNEVIKHGHPSYRVHWLRGWCNVGMHKYQEAINDCSLSIKNCKQFAAPYVVRGQAFALSGRLDQAEHDLNTAIRLFTAEAICNNPDYGWNGEPYYWRGWLHKVRRQPQEALADLSMSIKLNPKFPGGYFERAEVFDLLKLRKEAECDRETAEALKRSNSVSQHIESQ